MEKITLDNHPSVTIAYCNVKGTTWLVFGKYDDGYKYPIYRDSLNNIGGNPDNSKGDKCPEDVLLREINEEFDPNHPSEVEFGETGIWAPDNEIRLIRNALIANVEPYQDFLLRAFEIPNDSVPRNYTAIFSAFLSPISIEAFECVKDNLKKNQRLVTEGLTGISTLDELVKSDNPFATAHATAPILNAFFNSKILYPREIETSGLGSLPRGKFIDYLLDFQYSNKRHKFIFGNKN